MAKSCLVPGLNSSSSSFVNQFYFLLRLLCIKFWSTFHTTPVTIYFVIGKKKAYLNCSIIWLIVHRLKIPPIDLIFQLFYYWTHHLYFENIVLWFSKYTKYSFSSLWEKSRELYNAFLERRRNDVFLMLSVLSFIKHTEII